jgi:putative SOS response-associated peptidase YedK
VGEIHLRMPVILALEDYGVWLAPDGREVEPLLLLLEPYPDEVIEAYPVSAASTRALRGRRALRRAYGF